MKRNSEKYHLILEAAVKVFAEQGFLQSTVAQVAKKAGVADGTIYLYFKNKDDILIQFYGYKTRQVFDQFRKAVDTGNNAEEKLRNLVHTHLEEFQKDINMAIVYQAETHQHRRLAQDVIKEMSKWYRDIITEVVELGQEEGTMRRNLYLGLVMRLITGAVDEVINAWIHANGNYDLVSMADPLVDLIISGIGVADSPRRDAAGSSPVV
ncbi:MAG: TetR/AcrR family transcriptional regulator [Desulfobacteraceae bacterium]|jgi:TetR/AcrR family transcriptional regulator, fatty acid metabolism regulator protein